VIIDDISNLDTFLLIAKFGHPTKIH
jgi:hypothetical protein